MSEETRQKILALARELNYLPSAPARTLVTRRSHVIGMFLFLHQKADLLHPFFQEVVVGFKRQIGAAGYDLLLFANENGPASNLSFLERCRHHQVDGVVLMGGIDRLDPNVVELVQAGLPCMGVDVDVMGPRTGYVMSDNVSGAAEAVRYLHSLGHRRIAHITGLLQTRPGMDRLLGYRQELSRLGLPYRPEYVQPGDFDYDSGYSAMEALLDLAERPTAVFAASDLMAAGAIRAAHDRGLRVPEDVAVVGYDDIQIAPLLRPALTTVRQDKVGLGKAAGEALVRMIEDPTYSPPVLTLPVEIVIRESCGGR